MIPVYQTMTVANDGQGNCFNACVASILERPLRDVAAIHPRDEPYWSAWEDWFQSQGLELDLCDASDPPKGWSIANGIGYRIYPEGHPRAGKPIRHACVAFNGEVLHDPFPGGKGLQKIETYQVLCPISAVEREAA